jgi:hypothetical protein
MENRRVIIEDIDGELALTVLQKGYNIVDFTMYEPELAQQLLDKITEYEQERNN